MRRLRLLPLLCLPLLWLFACGKATQTPTQTPTVEPTQVVVTQAPTEAVLDGDDPVASPAPEAIDLCLACHMDKQQLIDTAKPEEEIVEESSGEG